MSKGSGTGGGSGGSSTRGANQSSRKVKNEFTGRRTLTGNAVGKLIAARGGITKLQVKSNSKVQPKSESQVSSNSGKLTKSKTQVHVKVQVSHAYRRDGGHGGPDIVLTSGQQAAIDAKNRGETMIRAEVVQIGKNGKRTSWIGNVKL